MPRRLSAPRRAAVAMAVAILAVVTVAATAPPAAAASPGDESALTGSINSERSGSGLGSLGVHSGLVGIARRQADRMASSGSLYHNPNLRSEVSAAVPD